ncbi:ExbD/TolR family protein [Sulfurospirillum sp. 1612]|uniref:ExbD/TolR family protein n=1 Tax=Sulfurospirillum sp. 1612 TaxID=3094835 RepID=UPI002F9263D6
MKIQKFDSINVVPFIDIILVLLVIVLTTATFMANGVIPVDLSQSKSAIQDKKPKILVITIKEHGDIFLNTQKANKADFEALLSRYPIKTPIHLNCDKSTKFDNFIFVLDILKQKGYENLGIITKHE